MEKQVFTELVAIGPVFIDDTELGEFEAIYQGEIVELSDTGAFYTLPLDFQGETLGRSYSWLLPKVAFRPHVRNPQAIASTSI